MKVLLLHGIFGNSQIKMDVLKGWGHEVKRPKLSNWSFKKAVRQAQAAYDEFQPDIVIGTSRGGAIAMNIKSGETPLILFSPAWMFCGKATEITKKAIVIHGSNDWVISPNDSLKLQNRNVKVNVIDDEHRCNGLGLVAMKWAMKAIGLNGICWQQAKLVV